MGDVVFIIKQQEMLWTRYDVSKVNSCSATSSLSEEYTDKQKGSIFYL